MAPASPIERGNSGIQRRPEIGLAALMLVVAGIAYFTGGPASPWIGVFYLALVGAGFTSMRLGLAMAAVASVLYGLLATFRPNPARPAGLADFGQALLFFGVAILTSELMRRMERRRRRQDQAAAEVLHALDIQHMINTAYDIDVTLDLVILKQRELLPGDSYAVLLAEKNVLRVRVASGLSPEGRDVRVNVNDDDHGWVPAEGRPLVVADTKSSPSHLGAIDPAARSILVVPMQSVERLVGLLFFGSRNPNRFPPEEVDRAEAFANRVVFPIQRALLEEDLRRLAFTDAQTNLYNHRHFQTQLDEEVRRAQRYGRAVSIILMDIDDFKSFNDRFGHPAGDRLLQELSRVLRENLRMVDIPARYGGEEFVVICPETQRDQAFVLADRLRATIEETPFDLGGGEPHHVTVSLGVAAFPSDAQNKGELVDAADKALYVAKRNGKNRVTAYEPA